LKQAQEVQIIMGYFLPTWRIRRHLLRVAGRGGRVQLILAGKSDVLLSRLAGQSLYRRFLNRGVEVYEYLPQVLHAKLIVVDDAVYIGSCNLDQRSLQINYELMLRVRDRALAEGARTIFQATLAQCRRIEKEQWRASRGLWLKLKERLAYWLLVRVDPYLARWFWRRIAD
jgi:cardiolipin synthase